MVSLIPCHWSDGKGKLPLADDVELKNSDRSVMNPSLRPWQARRSGIRVKMIGRGNTTWFCACYPLAGLCA